MRKLFIFALLLLTVSGCSLANNNEFEGYEVVKYKANDHEATENHESDVNINIVDPQTNREMISKMDQLNLQKFELEVDYANDKEYEAEIKVYNNIVKAELEDELNNTFLYDSEAFEVIYPLIEKLNISQQMSTEDAIKQSLTAFNLNDDYLKFELEITFKDGKKLKFKDRK